MSLSSEHVFVLKQCLTTDVWPPIHPSIPPFIHLFMGACAENVCSHVHSGVVNKLVGTLRLTEINDTAVCCRSDKCFKSSKKYLEEISICLLIHVCSAPGFSLQDKVKSADIQKEPVEMVPPGFSGRKDSRSDSEHAGCERLGIPQEDVEDVAGEKDVWASLLCIRMTFHFLLLLLLLFLSNSASQFCSYH